MEDLYSADDNASSTIDPDLKAKLDRDALNANILLCEASHMPLAFSREGRQYNHEGDDFWDRPKQLEKLERCHQMCHALMDRADCPVHHRILATYILAHQYHEDLDVLILDEEQVQQVARLCTIAGDIPTEFTPRDNKHVIFIKTVRIMRMIVGRLMDACGVRANVNNSYYGEDNGFQRWLCFGTEL